MMALQRYAGNPVLHPGLVPFPASLVFNAGVCKFKGSYVMVFRNDVGFSPAGWNHADCYTNLGIARSRDGVKWEVDPKPWQVPVEIIKSNPDFCRFYDPRLTVIGDKCYLCFAVDTHHGVRGGIAVTDDFEKFEILSLSAPDNRNMVLFPEKVNGLFVRLERPFPEYSRGYQEKFDVWMSKSPDCRFWGDTELVLGLESVPFCNAKIGPAAPPVKTQKGWLTTFHATYKDKTTNLKGWETANNPAATWNKEYLAGLMLLDINNPSKVIGMCPEPLLKAEKNYELDGFRGSVIFPGGMILEDDGEVKIYYGAADTVECLATAHVDDLLAMIKPV